MYSHLPVTSAGVDVAFSTIPSAVATHLYIPYRLYSICKASWLLV